MKKRILTVMILGAALACLLAVSASAVSDTVTASGTCGSKLTWKLYDDNELVISGTGKISLKKPSSLYSNMLISADGYISRGMMGYSAYTNTGIDIVKMYPVGSTRIIPQLCNGSPIDTARAQINNKADLYA